MPTEYWSVDPELKKEAEENYRTDFALKLKDKTPLEIIRELTFDGVVPNITISDIEILFRYIERYFLKKPLSGTGVEVGAGPLTFSSVLAKRPAVQKMYGIEICRPIVEALFPKISGYILSADADKATGVVGSFDAMELPDASVDFIFDFFSLHHSLNLPVTLRECARILKPGGFALCLDKARPDSYTQANLDELLDAVYSESYNRQFGLDPGLKITRRLNGEREYRLRDWRKAFLDNGFSRFEHAALVKTTGGSRISSFLKSVLGVLPPLLQEKITVYLPERRLKHKFIHSSDNTVFAAPVNAFRKEMSLMIAYK